MVDGVGIWCFERATGFAVPLDQQVCHGSANPFQLNINPGLLIETKAEDGGR
jgi:hypothetical protein